MSDFFDKMVQQLSAAGIEQPMLETRLILAHVKQCETAEILSTVNLTNEEKQTALALLARRLAHEPLDKIVGHREFYKADFAVNNDVLSPRPDTETLVETVLEYYSDYKATLQILDLGTGSGCIIESLLQEYEKAHGVAVDFSAAALKVARQNATRLKLNTRLDFVEADWFATDFVEKISKSGMQKFDIIVTNPPYIPSDDIVGLAPEVKNFDPRTALDGGADGLDSYRQIAEIAPILLADGGHIFIEAGIGQADDIAVIFEGSGLKLKEIRADLAGIARCVVLKKT